LVKCPFLKRAPPKKSPPDHENVNQYVNAPNDLYPINLNVIAVLYYFVYPYKQVGNSQTHYHRNEHTQIFKKTHFKISFQAITARHHGRDLNEPLLYETYGKNDII